MSRRQPNRASALLATALGVAVVISRVLLHRDISPATQYTALGLTLLLALAYLGCVFLIRPEPREAKDGARTAQLDEWLKNGIIDEAEYRALKARRDQGPKETEGQR